MKFGPTSAAAAAAIAMGMMISPVAQAATYADFATAPIADTYQGGKTPSGYGDVVARPADVPSFNISSMSVTKSGNDLTVVINTGYADTVGLGNKGALDTYVGALFIGTGVPSFNTGTAGSAGSGSSADNYATDTYKADVAAFGVDDGRFDYAFVPGQKTTAGALADNAETGAALYELKSESDVQYSYYPNPATTTGNNFRNGQAVGYKGDTASPEALGSWAINKANDTITFKILSFFTLTDIAGSVNSALTFAWAMTCANDVIIASVPLRVEAPPVPIPASLLLLVTGLAGLGGLGRLKAKRAAAAASA